MSGKEHSLNDIQKFILFNVEQNPQNITAVTANNFNISRNAVLRHLHQLIDLKYIAVEGSTKNRKYSLDSLESYKIEIPITSDLAEDKIWREHVVTLFSQAPENVKSICQYGFTEMVNNVLDHSDAKILSIECSVNYVQANICIHDNGIGIFNKLQNECHLENELHAVLELAKGKLTTDSERHSGEGIFFTSRLFEHFSIISGDVCFIHFPDGEDWATELKNPLKESSQGTEIQMQIRLDSQRKLEDVFEEYTTADDIYSFSRTVVPVFLAQYGEENLISRSQAKRLLARFEFFREVILDFNNVNLIGQAFADEVFRVFANKTPNTRLTFVNANFTVTKMIKRATGER